MLFSSLVITKGQRTRQTILDLAVDVASTEGLEALSFGKIAAQLGMSKSGLFAHFGSKLGLQLATVEAAQVRFVDAVLRPVLAQPRGLPRLWTLCDRWLHYAQGGVFKGGCFFAAVAAEYNNRPGEVRDRIAALTAAYTDDLERALEAARDQGHLAADSNPRQVAFELHALMAGANAGHQLIGGDEPFARAWEGIRARLRAVLTPDAPLLPGLQEDDPTPRWRIQ